MYVVKRMVMNDECCTKRHNLTECATVRVLAIAKLTPMGTKYLHTLKKETLSIRNGIIKGTSVSYNAKRHK